MFLTLKAIHFVALLIGGAVSIGNALISMQISKNADISAEAEARLRKALSITGVAAILLLWITGGLMALTAYGGLAINAAFTIKLLAATVVLGGTLMAAFLGAKSAPPVRILETLGKIIGLSVLVAILCAVLAFS